MKRIFAVAAACAFVAGTAMAQTTPPANQAAPTNPAVSSPGPNNPGAPAPGANSFTEGQAKARIEAQGFTAVSALEKDKDGIWRGKATRNGQTVGVAVDYQGNVVAN